MDPITLALATFGVQKLRGQSTKRAFRDALIVGGIGQLGGMAGVGQGTMGKWAPQAFGQTGNIIGQQGMSIAQQAATTMPGKAASWAMGDKAIPASVGPRGEKIAGTSSNRSSRLEYRS